jgi:transcription-repair coupling factor (superfamily II helicase)
MRDLELRGAGNLLGPEQSGHIVGVGFDLYCQLLRQSVARLKGDKSATWVRATLKLDFVVLAPETRPRPAALHGGALPRGTKGHPAGRDAGRPPEVPPRERETGRLRNARQPFSPFDRGRRHL